MISDKETAAVPAQKRGFSLNGGNNPAAVPKHSLQFDGSATSVPVSSGVAASTRRISDLTDDEWQVLPKQMRSAKRWLLHSVKIPYYVNGSRRSGKLDSPEEVARLATFDDVLAALRAAPNRWAGIGIALGGDGADIIAGIDLDGCVSESGKLACTTDVKRIIKQAIKDGCYIERSPSGRGLHIMGRTTVPFRTIASGEDGIEAYWGKRFFTVTADCVTATAGRLGSLDKSVAIATEVRGLSPPNLGSTEVTERGRKLTEAMLVVSAPEPETEENIARVSSALSALDPDCSYALWRDIVFAVHSTQWSCAEELARAWSMGALRKGTSHE